MTTIYRGYEIKKAEEGVYVIYKNGEVVGTGTHATEQNAFDWINPLADEAVREAVRKRKGASQ